MEVALGALAAARRPRGGEKRSSGAWARETRWGSERESERRRGESRGAGGEHEAPGSESADFAVRMRLKWLAAILEASSSTTPSVP
ncbi:unnamed protein product [Lampetra planeri]